MGNPVVKWELGASSVSGKESGILQGNKISFDRSTINSVVPLTKVEVYLPSGKLLYGSNQNAAANSVVLPQSILAQGSLSIFRVTNVNGEIAIVTR